MPSFYFEQWFYSSCMHPPACTTSSRWMITETTVAPSPALSYFPSSAQDLVSNPISFVPIYSKLSLFLSHSSLDAQSLEQCNCSIIKGCAVWMNTRFLRGNSTLTLHISYEQMLSPQLGSKVIVNFCCLYIVWIFLKCSFVSIMLLSLLVYDNFVKVSLRKNEEEEKVLVTEIQRGHAL